MLGIILIDKPQGISSHDAINALRRRFHTKRIGHAGTLDPLATGLLVVAVGPATRFLQYLPLEPKHYSAKIKFGESTTTYDSEGEIIDTQNVPGSLEDLVKDAMQAFRGLIEQTPPMYSAIKVDGKPLYELARKGITVPRKSRQVYIYSLELLTIESNTAEVSVECSGGTYIRSIAHDLGTKVGCGAHLVELKRIQVGKFLLEDSCSIDESDPTRLITLDRALDQMQGAHLDEFESKLACDGVPLKFHIPELPDGTKVKLIAPNHTFLGIARYHEATLYPECVLPKEHIGTF